MKTTFKDFWMITRKPMRGKNTPTFCSHRHYTEDLAIKEANRLAAKTGEPFVILKTTERVNPPER